MGRGFGMPSVAGHGAGLWDIATGKHLLELGHKRDIFSAAFSPDGTRVVTGGLGRAARFWAVKTGAQLKELKHPSAVKFVLFSPDGERILTISPQNEHVDPFKPSLNGGTRLWDARTGKELWHRPDGPRFDTSFESKDEHPHGHRDDLLAMRSFENRGR